LAYFDVETNVDNLHFSTIAGDLGQSATLVNEDTGHEEGSTYIGDGTEATEAELVGDIDGFNMGAQFGEEGGRDTEQPLSQILMDYYRGVYEEENRNRYDNFETVSEVGDDDFEQQVIDFADVYEHRNKGGLFSDTEEEAQEATAQFRTWLREQQADTTNNSVETEQDTITIRSRGDWVYVVDNPNQWRNEGGGRADYLANKSIIKDTVMAGPPAYPEGVQAVILDEGNGELFNEVRSAQYRWVRVHIVTGASTGTTGWVSNAFVERTAQ
jgi:hypothetical protein